MPLQTAIKVLHVVRTPDLSAGGFVSYIDSLRQSLVGRDIDTDIESVFPRNQRARVMALRTPLRFFQRVRRRLTQADLLHVHGIFGWHVLLGVWAARLAGRPYVLTLHGHLHREALRERYLVKRLYLALMGHRILRDAAAVLVTTPAEAAIARRYVPERRVREVVPGLDLNQNQNQNLDAAIPHKPKGARGESLRVLFIGRLHSHKGLRELLRALAGIQQDGFNIRLQIAGHGHAHELRRVVRDIDHLGVRDHVELLGYVEPEERNRLLRHADLVVLPSRSENFGFAVAEALAAGVPVIVTAGVGLADVVARWRCGIVVPVGDTDALGAALAVYRDPLRRRSEGVRARDAAMACFSLAQMGTACEALYGEAVETASDAGHLRAEAEK